MMRRARGSITTDVARSRTRSPSKCSASDKNEPEKCYFSGPNHRPFAPDCKHIAKQWIWWNANRGPKARNVCNECRNQFVKSAEAVDLEEDVKEDDGEDDDCSEPEMNANPSEHGAAEVETWQLCCPHCDQLIIVKASRQTA